MKDKKKIIKIIGIEFLKFIGDMIICTGGLCFSSYLVHVTGWGWH